MPFTHTKAKITITNYLCGQYFLTVDEIKLTSDTVSLIEGKHSTKALLPSKGDIKDGLLKMILYCNLSDVTANGKKIKSEDVLCLTSAKLKGAVTSESTKKEIEEFFEAKQNKFITKIQFSK